MKRALDHVGDHTLARRLARVGFRSIFESHARNGNPVLNNVDRIVAHTHDPLVIRGITQPDDGALPIGHRPNATRNGKIVGPKGTKRGELAIFTGRTWLWRA